MQAVVLAGGLGTRLRPITLSRPKSLLPVLNRPLILRVMDLLGPEVDEVLVATGYMGDRLCSFFRDMKGGPRVEVVVERSPLGTGGALKQLEKKIRGTFVVVNGDVICSLDITKMLSFHRGHKGLGTLSLWEVEDPTPFGMVVTDKQGRIMEFKEKPKREEVVSHAVNAGTYILEPEVLSYMGSVKETSLEREVFPKALERGLYGFCFAGYWFDAGTLDSYLRIHAELMRRTGPSRRPGGPDVSASSIWEPPFSCAPGCSVGDRSVIGPDACLGAGVSVGGDCALSECVLHDEVRVGDRVRLEGCLVGEKATIRDGARIPPGTIIGDGKVVG